MSVLHPESINTVRLATFKIQNEVHIVGAALRMGKAIRMSTMRVLEEFMLVSILNTDL